MTIGLIYCARGEKYLKRAELSVKSLKRFHPELACSICTTESPYESAWDSVISLDGEKQEKNQYMRDKLETLIRSPYEHTLYLDSDTYIVEPIIDLFKLLEKFDLAICHGHNRQKRFDIQTGNASINDKRIVAISPSIPYAFAPLQGGLILYKKNKNVKNWLKDLNELYRSKNFYDDQVSIRELLWNSNLKFYILPPEYNFNSVKLLKYWKSNHYKQARPKIFHYTVDKNTNIEKLLYSVYNPRKSNWLNLEKKYNFLPTILKNKLKMILEDLK